MASTVDLKNLTEYFDPEEELKSKIEELAGLFKAAKRVLFFTGAGISTSASIPDFRGPEGCWTNQALGKAPPKSISMIKAQPTECHMGIVACLQTKNSQPLGATIESTPASSSSPPSSSSSSSLSSSAALSPVWGRVVSQNIDGLHRRSGIAAKDISELHGNLFQEVCWGCQKSYLRTFEIKSGGRYAGGACPECTKRVPYFCHCTSRLCGACGGRLKDSIIHFKENLPAGEVTKAFRWADEADLCIVLGSSCTVSPACLVPKTVAKRGGHLVIVNLQKTPLDHLAKLRIFCKTDQFMRLFLAAAGVAPVAWDPAQDLVGEPCQVDDDEEDDADVPVEDIDSFFSSSAVTQAIAASGLPSSTTTPSTTPSTTASGSDGQTDGSSFITAPFEDLTDDQDKGGYVDPIKDCPHATNLATAPTLEAARALVEGHCHDCEEAKERWVCLHCLQARCGRYKQAHAVSHQGAHPDHAVALSLEDLTTWCYQCSSYILSEDTESLQLSFYVAKFGALPDGCSSDMST